MLEKMARQLIQIPIIHTQADLGSISDSVRQLYVRTVGRNEWERRVKVVDEMWICIREEIERLHLPYGKVRLYQDGLPNCGREQEMASELAQAGSENYRIVMELMGKGAELTGTESPELLMREYEFAKEVVNSLGSGKTKDLAQRQRELSGLMLEKRDRYIADRIDKTLRVGEIGLIFLGMLHSLADYLPADIQVRFLSHKFHPVTRKKNTERATRRRRPGASK